MNKVVTLLGFLEATGARVSIFDIGRRLEKISRSDFEKIESQQLPYPYPLQQQAWFALSLLDPEVSAEPIIWFLHFPLDESGHLQLASRDYFLHRLFEAATARQAQNDTELCADALKDNPHVFKPRDDKMAAFHSRLAQRLKQPPSRFYPPVRDYLAHRQWDQWSKLGLQGIADLTERLDTGDNEPLLIEALPRLPAQPLEAFCSCLENQTLSLALSQALESRLDQELNTDAPSPALLAHLVRAVTGSISKSVQQAMYRRAMDNDSSGEVLAAIAARNWEWLTGTGNAELYLEKLSQTSQDVFNRCMTDLLYMPGLRDRLLGVIRSPDRPDSLAVAFNRLVSNISNG